ncbi:MAG: hypothetical protein ACREJU_18755 [Nitrospiraceae bacterium]
MRKQSFDVARAFQSIGKAIVPFPKAAMFQLADEGFSSPFEQLIACLISVRTRDDPATVMEPFEEGTERVRAYDGKTTYEAGSFQCEFGVALCCFV